MAGHASHWQQFARQALGDALSYEVTLEPHQQRWLLTLEATIAPPQAALRRLLGTADLQWLGQPPHHRSAALPGPGIAALCVWRNTERLPAWLRLPPDLNPRTVAWARALRQQHGRG